MKSISFFRTVRAVRLYSANPDQANNVANAWIHALDVKVKELDASSLELPIMAALVTMEIQEMLPDAVTSHEMFVAILTLLAVTRDEIEQQGLDTATQMAIVEWYNKFTDDMGQYVFSLVYDTTSAPSLHALGKIRKLLNAYTYSGFPSLEKAGELIKDHDVTALLNQLDIELNGSDSTTTTLVSQSSHFLSASQAISQLTESTELLEKTAVKELYFGLNVLRKASIQRRLTAEPATILTDEPADVLDGTDILWPRYQSSTKAIKMRLKFAGLASNHTPGVIQTRQHVDFRGNNRIAIQYYAELHARSQGWTYSQTTQAWIPPNNTTKARAAMEITTDKGKAFAAASLDQLQKVLKASSGSIANFVSTLAPPTEAVSPQPGAKKKMRTIKSLEELGSLLNPDPRAEDPNLSQTNPANPKKGGKS